MIKSRLFSVLEIVIKLFVSFLHLTHFCVVAVEYCLTTVYVQMGSFVVRKINLKKINHLVNFFHCIPVIFHIHLLEPMFFSVIQIFDLHDIIVYFNKMNNFYVLFVMVIILCMRAIFCFG